ncbi:MAG: ABC transporter ATP-binding protein [Gammaproteobacteria bacterium]|nr:MAG: ABC transporter ATP-binding protein [Gammaproteobacteria bacterium]
MKALEIRRLRKVYPNGFEALKGIDLDVEEGEFFALLGPNGAGKSTTIGIVSSLIRRTEGRVRIFGHDPERAPVAAKRCLGLVPQEFNFNVFEPVEEILVNMAGYYGIPRAQARRRAERYLEELGLEPYRRTMARNLSGGLKRRLMIARALMHAPRLLILDEPTAGVDIEIRRSMWEYLRRINAAGTTIILTTHYLEEAESLCRRIAIIHQGRIIEHSSMKALLARLDTETFVLDLRRPLSAPPPDGDCRFRCLDPLTLEVDVPRHRSLNELFCHLAERGIEVMSMRNKTNRLEQLFMRLVREEPGGGSDAA